MSNIFTRLEDVWRHGIVYPSLKMLIGRSQRTETIDLKNVQKILFLRHDRIGDMIVTTPIFRCVKQAYPKIRIGVLATNVNEEIIRYNPSVDKVHAFSRNWIKNIVELIRMKRERYDVVVNLIFNKTTSIALMLAIIARNAITVSQGDEKYRFYFDRYYKLARFSDPMVVVLAAMMKVVFAIELDEKSLEYEIVIDKKAFDEVASFLTWHSLQLNNSNQRSRYIVFNLSAFDAERKISIAQAKAIVRSLAAFSSYRIILVTAPDDNIMQELGTALCRTDQCILFMETGFGTLLQLAVLLKYASAALSPDTSVVHFASAVKTPVIGFFTPRQGMQEWLPFHVRHECVFAEQDKSVSDIPENLLTQKIRMFLNEVLEA